MINFIHTADLHFGMENYGRIDPKSGIHSRLLDFDRALNFCIDYAIEKQVDFFLFSGDAYKTATPTPTHQRLLLNCFLRLFKANIPLIIIVGNHDNPLSFGKAHALEIFGQIPINGFHVIAQPTSLKLDTKNGPVQIVGIPWPSRANLALNAQHTGSSVVELASYISDSVSTIIKQFAAELDPSIPAVLGGHLTVSNGIFSGSEKRAIYGTDPVLLPSQLAIAPFDYIGLGHLHRYQNLNMHGYPAVVYSGSIERVDFGERKEDKGFCHVTIKEKGATEHEFIRTPTRPFLQLDVQLSADKSHTEQILAELRKQPIEGAVVKIVYHLPADTKDRVDVNVIQNACSEAHYLVGIFPVRPLETRTRRAEARVDMKLEELLDNYFANKPDWQARRSSLIKKALELEPASDDHT
jgi:exonuclease SbcD